VKLLYGLACQLVAVFAVLEAVRWLWSADRRGKNGAGASS